MSDTDDRRAPFQPWRTFQPDAGTKPYAWLQWKGTNACLDVHCACGELAHVDGDFAYYVKCAFCDRVYELSGFIEMREVNPHDLDARNPVTAR